MDGHLEWWDRISRLYVAFEQHRHAVVHRRVIVAVDGSLTGHDSAGGPLRPVSLGEQDAWLRLAFALADVVAAGCTDARTINGINWALDQLVSVHGLRELEAVGPPETITEVVDDLGFLGGSRWRLDGGRLHAHLREQSVRLVNADAELHATDGGTEVVYRACLADVPKEVIEFEATESPYGYIAPDSLAALVMGIGRHPLRDADCNTKDR